MKVRIKFADELPDCPDCGEKWCPDCLEHYADCTCPGPMNAEDMGFTLVEENGILYGIKEDI
jgi:hypothetical protein